MKRFLFAVALLASACDLAPRVSSDTARDQWATIGPPAKAKIAELRNRQTVVGGRAAALRVPAGVTDPPLTALVAELQQKAGELEAAISGYEQVTSQVGGEIEAALARKDKIAARRAVDSAGPRIDQAYAAASAPFSALEQRLPDAEAAASKYLAIAAAEEQRLVRAASEGGAIDLPAVRFAGSALLLEDAAGKAALDRVVLLGNACEQLRMTVSAHVADYTSAAGKTLAAARAGAVKAYLVAAGVPDARITVGADPGKAQGAEHVQVLVTTGCMPPPAADPHAGHGHGAPPVPQGAMPPPPIPVVERMPQPAAPRPAPPN